MREDRRKRYDDGFRHEALGLIKAGAGKHFLARRLAMPVQTAEKWIMKYRSNGEDAVMGAKGKRSYDWGTKVAAARDHVDNDMTKTEVMAKYAIASDRTMALRSRLATSAPAGRALFPGTRPSP